jgi:hypothetical protein
MQEIISAETVNQKIQTGFVPLMNDINQKLRHRFSKKPSTGRIFYRVPEDSSWYGMSRLMQSFSAIKLPCTVRSQMRAHRNGIIVPFSTTNKTQRYTIFFIAVIALLLAWVSWHAVLDTYRVLCVQFELLMMGGKTA